MIFDVAAVSSLVFPCFSRTIFFDGRDDRKKREVARQSDPSPDCGVCFETVATILCMAVTTSQERRTLPSHI